ncbi:unnamed protein product [Rotaria sordida]|nr:unnamed protein product [Rotaria sordida]
MGNRSSNKNESSSYAEVEIAGSNGGNNCCDSKRKRMARGAFMAINPAGALIARAIRSSKNSNQSLDSHKFIRKNVRILDSATIVDWKNFMHDLCGEYFIRLPATIGVVNHVVEIDESVWTKRKYNRGRLVNTQWVFGSIDWDTRVCFAVVVDRHDAATLMPIIHQYILLGTTIYSDQWRAYNAITNGRDGADRYVHETYSGLEHGVNKRLT